MMLESALEGRRVLLLALTLAACPLAGRAQEPSWSLERPSAGTGPTVVVSNIYKGTPTADFPAVVGLAITNRDGTGIICSGTLIAPSAVLTAGHCLAFHPIAATAVVFPDGGTGVSYTAAAFDRHPRFSLARAAVADIAIVILASPVADVAPMPLARRSPRPGTTGTIVGFGEDAPGGRVGVKEFGTVRLRRCPRVVRVQNGKVRLTKSLCWRPEDLVNDTCSGDSGGPLIVNGQVAGVTSGGIGTGECPGVLSFDTNVTRYRTWIARVLRQ
jgi:V8-like Glu-specific endopeptidase